MDHTTSIEDGTDEGHAPTGLIPSFRLGLAQAMHGAAARERERIAEMVAGDAKDHVEKAHARAVIEAAELRRLADEDVHAIEAWSATEITRISREAERRTQQRRADLASYLELHRAIIATEIAGVETAVVEYSASLGRFIEELIGSNDPTEIARRAESVPTPPKLDQVRADARANAVAAYEDADDVAAAQMLSETAADRGVGVMDPGAAGRPGELPLAVDPLQVPEDEVAAATATPASADNANGAIRLFRAIAPWTTSSGSPTEDDPEAPRS
jgi:hypothetical protein